MKIKIPVISEAKESKGKVIPPLVIVVLLLASSTIGVYYFHSYYQVKDVSDQYNEDWYRQNSKARLPEDIADLLRNLSDVIGESDLINNPEVEVPPEAYASLLSNETAFFVEGQVDPLVWKITALTRYVPNSGWRFNRVAEVDYTPAEPDTYDYRYMVIKHGVVVNKTASIYIPILLMNGIGSGEFSYTNLNLVDVLEPETPPTPTINFDSKFDSNSGGSIVKLTSDIGANITFSYYVYGSILDENFVASVSGSVDFTSSLASSDPYLSKFIVIPQGYLDDHPNVRNLVEELRLSPDASVYEQVKNVLTALSLRFEIKNESAPSGLDPVDWFVVNGGGTPIYFVYTAALILRAYGIPTRVAVGYAYGNYIPSANLTEFTMGNHIFIWLEVYDGGLNQWVNYNAIPFLFSDITGLPKPYNLIDLTITPVVTILAPRYISGVPSVYLDENFTVIVTIIGLNDTRVIDSFTIYDLNVSASVPLSEVPMTTTGDSISGVWVGNYTFIYDNFGVSPSYGLHVLKIVIGSQVIYRDIVLLRRVTTSP